jgi:hypothetical protein
LHLAVLRDAQMQGMATDDRPPRSSEFYPELNAQSGVLIDKYADRNPHHYTQAERAGTVTELPEVDLAFTLDR